MNRVFFLFFLFLSSLFADIFSFQTIEKANRAYNSGEFEHSARLFNTLSTKDAIIFYNIANAYYKAGLYDKALRSYKKAKGVDEAICFYNMGNSYFKKNEFKKAIDFYIKSLNIKEDRDARYNLGLAKKREKKKESNNRDKKKRYGTKKKLDKDISTQDKIRKDELSYLLKQINRKKIPTIMYNLNRGEKENSDKNPW